MSILEQFEDKYFADKEGNIYSTVGTQKVLKGKISSWGYHVVLLTGKGFRKHILAHRIVAQEFVPNPNNFNDVNHKDGNKLNNKASNLEWTNDKANLKHARDFGLLKTCKINMQTAKDIRFDYSIGNTSFSKLSEKYGLKKTQIGYIIKGSRWKD